MAGGYLATVSPWHLPLAWPVGLVGDADRLARDQTQNQRKESRNRRLREKEKRQKQRRRDAGRKRERKCWEDQGSEEERKGKLKITRKKRGKGMKKRLGRRESEG